MKIPALLIFAVIALAGCGSATDAITFKAPPSYTAAVSVGPFMQIWRGPQESVLILMAIPTKTDLKGLTKESDVKDAQVLSQSSVRICGSQPAYYLSVIGERDEPGSGTPNAKPEKRQIDMIATYVGAKTYMAMYIRPVGSSVDTAAEAAIRNICPKT
ncbi:MAG TPA: hypothetical protein VMA98_09865 [Candidatus Acidoferrales bacterium]|nr:hypothetical protein [Candidatus Acidoferrales bacterium]